MATRPGAVQHRVSDLVVDSEIDATWDPSTNQTTQIRRAAGTRPGRRREKTEEIWERKHELGGGAYGTVWLEECFAVSSQQEPRVRAVKEIRKHPSVPTSAFHRELEAIAKFSHDKFADCFVRSFGWFQNETALFITMEYLEHGDLRHYIVRPFPEPEARLIAMQLVEALQSMHKSGFAHRDLKPSNILVVHRGPRWWVKICDFGISKRVEGSTALKTMEIGTMGYMAPEVLGVFTLEDLQDNQTEVVAYTSAVDLWALGEIAHKLLTQKATFLSPNQRASYVTMGTQFPTNELESIGASTHCILFVQQTMAASPRKRLTADEAADHKWLENYEDIDEAQGRSSPESTNETSASKMIAQDYEASAQWTVTSRPSQWTGGRSRKTSTISHPSESSSEAAELPLHDKSNPTAPPGIEEDDQIELVTSKDAFSPAPSLGITSTKFSLERYSRYSRSIQGRFSFHGQESQSNRTPVTPVTPLTPGTPATVEPEGGEGSVSNSEEFVTENLSKDKALQSFESASDYFSARVVDLSSKGWTFTTGAQGQTDHVEKQFLPRDCAGSIITSGELRERLIGKVLLPETEEHAAQYCERILTRRPTQSTSSLPLEPGLRVILLIILCHGNQEMLAHFEQRFLKDDDLKDLTDELLPLGEAKAHEVFGERHGSTFFQCQFQFTPATIIKGGFPCVVEAPSPLPFIEQEQIESGAYATVFKVKVERNHLFLNQEINHRNSGPVNLIRKDFSPDSESILAFRAENDIIKFLARERCHETIMQSFCSLIYSLPDGNSSRNSPQIASILSYPAKYTLFHYITNNSSPSAKERRENIFRMKSIGEGLEWLRSKLEYDHAGQQHVSVTYYHCDLKPENIFVYEGTHNSPFPVQWKIGDFGSAFRWQNPLFDESEERIASPPVLRGRGREATYLAPEVQLQDKTKPKSDVWPFGCVLLLVILFNHGGKDGITSFAENRIKCSDPSRRGDHFAANSRNVNCNPAVTECIDSLIEISNRLMGLPDGRYYRLAKEVLEYIKQSMIVIHRKRDEIKDVVKRLRTIYDRESAIDPIPINRENVPRKSLHCGSSPDGHMVFFASSKEIAVYDDNDGTPAHLALVPASGGDKWTDDLLPTSRSCANLAVFTLPGSKNRGAIHSTVRIAGKRKDPKYVLPERAELNFDIERAALSPDQTMFALFCRPKDAGPDGAQVRLYHADELQQNSFEDPDSFSSWVAKKELLGEECKLKTVNRICDLFFSPDGKSLYCACKVNLGTPAIVHVIRWNTETKKRVDVWDIKDDDTRWRGFFVSGFVPLNGQPGFLCIKHGKIANGTLRGDGRREIRTFEFGDSGSVPGLKTLLLAPDDTRVIMLATPMNSWQQPGRLQIFGCFLGDSSFIKPILLKTSQQQNLTYDPDTDSACLRRYEGETALCLTLLKSKKSYIYKVEGLLSSTGEVWS